jgi:hypothetical protein
MTPIKLEQFLRDTKPAQHQELRIDLNELGLFHAAPKEDGRPILALRFDAASGTLVPAR